MSLHTTTVVLFLAYILHTYIVEILRMNLLILGVPTTKNKINKFIKQCEGSDQRC